MTHPFRTFILKVHSRCNLDCDYCYVYHHADQNWKRQPRRMSEATLRRSAERIEEHAARHQLSSVQVVLHGGEPLLAGAAWLDAACTTLREVVTTPTVHLSMQSNATLLDEDMLDVLLRHRVRVGLSLDGARGANDLHRVDHAGASSFDAAERGVRLLTREAWRSVFAGFLCTIDLRAPPVETYEFLCSFDPPGIDFLLPHGHWGAPPPGKQEPLKGAPYADWLLPIFERWYSEPAPRVQVRLFTELMSLTLGGRSRDEAIGLEPITLVVVETDGTYEGVDTLKSTYDGAVRTDMSVVEQALDEVLQHPMVAARQAGVDALGARCRSCDVMRVCGGGYYPHRYDPATGFQNPSIFCSDLFALCTHVGRRLRSDLARAAGR